MDKRSRGEEFYMYGIDADRDMIVREFFSWLLSDKKKKNINIRVEDYNAVNKGDSMLRINWEEMDQYIQ